jgi:Flp pilus assembly pilin Flp
MISRAKGRGLVGRRVIQFGSSPRLKPRGTTILAVRTGWVKGIKSLTELHIGLRKWQGDIRGTTSVEYAILLALIILICFTAIATIGNPTLNGFQQVIEKGGFGTNSP